MGDLKHTQRGFAYIEFQDRYDHKCSIQKSSLATEDAIWFGIDDANPQVLHGDARRLGIETDATSGWVPYPLPSEVSLSTRMHLTQDQVRELLPTLIHFAETGDVLAPADCRTQPETVDGDPIGDLQAESRQAKLDDFIASMKTQPEATAPAAPTDAFKEYSQRDLLMMHDLSRKLLWLAYVWNDHNFAAAHLEARRVAEEWGIKSFDDANRYLEKFTAPAQDLSAAILAAVDRFLCWELPRDFNPDGGININTYGHQFDRIGYWPTGTNLFTAKQAKAMFEHCFASSANALSEADRVDAIADAARSVLREALDAARVHPCDSNNDNARAKQLSPLMQRLYRVILQSQKGDSRG